MTSAYVSRGCVATNYLSAPLSWFSFGCFCRGTQDIDELESYAVYGSFVFGLIMFHVMLSDPDIQNGAR